MQLILQIAQIELDRFSSQAQTFVNNTLLAPCSTLGCQFPGDFYSSVRESRNLEPIPRGIESTNDPSLVINMTHEA